MSAEVVGDGVDSVDSGNGDGGVLDDLAVLDVKTTDLVEVAVGCAIGGDELGNDSELAAGVNGHTLAEERFVAHAERVEVTSVLVAKAGVPLVVITALSTRALGLAVDGTGVRSESSSIVVGLPDIHLRAAGTEVAASGVGVAGRTGPTRDVGLYEAGIVSKLFIDVE